MFGKVSRSPSSDFDRVAAEVFVNLVIGATLPDAGDVLSFGTPTRAITDADEWLSGMHRFGILSERVVLLESCTVEQNLALPFSLEIDRIPEEVSLASARPGRRGGHRLWPARRGCRDAERRRAPANALAKALALGPRVLLGGTSERDDTSGGGVSIRG